MLCRTTSGCEGHDGHEESHDGCDDDHDESANKHQGDYDEYQYDSTGRFRDSDSWKYSKSLKNVFLAPKVL